MRQPDNRKIGLSPSGFKIINQQFFIAKAVRDWHGDLFSRFLWVIARFVQICPAYSSHFRYGPLILIKQVLLTTPALYTDADNLNVALKSTVHGPSGEHLLKSAHKDNSPCGMDTLPI